jgi:hypothetical protein
VGFLVFYGKLVLAGIIFLFGAPLFNVEKVLMKKRFILNTTGQSECQIAFKFGNIFNKAFICDDSWI